jgi:CheY-like chemotaxis protein
MKKWILVIEGNPLESELTSRALAATLAPPDVLVTRNGAEAADCLCRQNGFANRSYGDPALVLLGLHLPDMAGWDLLHSIKTHPQLKRIPVVIFTASIQAADIEQSYLLGANGYVVKPAGSRQLAAALEYVRAFWIVANVPPPSAVVSNSSSELASAA